MFTRSDMLQIFLNVSVPMSVRLFRLIKTYIEFIDKQTNT